MAISRIVVFQGRTLSCEAGIILAGRGFIKSATERDIFNLSGFTAWRVGIPAHAFSDSPDPGAQTLAEIRRALRSRRNTKGSGKCGQ